MDRTTGRSSEWISYVKNTIAKVACEFTTNRMLTDYTNQYYAPQAVRATSVKADDFLLARQIAAWKAHVRREWNNVQLVSRSTPQTSYDITQANQYHVEQVLSLGDLTPEDIGVEVVFAQVDKRGQRHIAHVQEFEVAEFKDGQAKYSVDVLPEKTGAYEVCSRVFAKNPLMPHRQDFECVKWL